MRHEPAHTKRVHLFAIVGMIGWLIFITGLISEWQAGTWGNSSVGMLGAMIALGAGISIVDGSTNSSQHAGHDNKQLLMELLATYRRAMKHIIQCAFRHVL
jgi:hypothetical protein